MSAKRFAAVLMLYGLALLGGCQSSPATHYFALSALAPSAAVAPLATQVPLRVERVTIPGELDRLELVRRGSANRLQIAAFDRWAAPLDEMIRRVVAADLTARIGAAAMASMNEPAVGEPRRHLYIEIQEFSGDARGAVELRATWLVQTPDAASLRGDAHAAVAAGDGSADALAEAMSRALAVLSDQVSAALAPHSASEKSAEP